MPKYVIRCEMDDCVPYLYSREYADATLAGYPEHERDARGKGSPQLGSGRVFPVVEECIVVDAFDLPDHWPQIVGLDIGWDHPTAAARHFWDRDNDCVYVTGSYRERHARIPVVASAIRGWGTWIPVAWPHDGLQHDKQSGKQYAQLYREEGLTMCHEHSTHEAGGFGTEAGVADMLTRMETGRWKVFSHLREWRDEFRTYHRKDGLIVKERDDLMSASRMACMMLREAKTKPSGDLAKTLGESAGDCGWMGA